MPADRSRIVRLGTLLSQFVNVLIFDGMADEAVSGRAWRQGMIEGHAGWARAVPIIDRLYFWQPPGHCRRSHALDVAFARMILETMKH